MPINLYTKTLIFVEADSKSATVPTFLTSLKTIFHSQIVPNYAMAQHAFKFNGNQKMKLFTSQTSDTLQFTKRLVLLTCTADVVAPCFNKLATKTSFFCKTLKVLECCANKKSENDLLVNQVLSHIDQLTSLESLNLFGINDEAASRLGQISSPFFQSLNLSDCNSVTDRGLEFLQRLPALKILNLNDNTRITNKTLSYLTSMKDSLQSLSLSRCDNITNEGLVFLKDFSALQSLTLDYCTEISGKGLENLFSAMAIFVDNNNNCRRNGKNDDASGTINSSNISTTLARNNDGNNSSCLLADHNLNNTLSTSNTNNNKIRKNNQNNDNNIEVGGGSSDGLLPIVNRSADDDSLHHSGTNYDSPRTQSSSAGTPNNSDDGQGNSNNNIHHDGPRTVGGLKSLYLSSCSNIDDDALSFIGRKLHASLTTLSLAFCTKITSSGISEHFKRMSILENLDLRYCEQLASDECLKTIGKCMTSLKALNLYKCLGVTNKGLLCLNILPNLQYLNISKCQNVTDRGLRNLTSKNNTSSSTTLTMNNENDDDPPTEAPAVGVVSASSTNHHPQPATSNNNNTKSSSAASPLCSSLLVLHVSDCKSITDNGLSHLHFLTALRFLNIVFCDKITQQGKEALERVLPKLNISHSIVPQMNPLQTVMQQIRFNGVPLLGGGGGA